MESNQCQWSHRSVCGYSGGNYKRDESTLRRTRSVGMIEQMQQHSTVMLLDCRSEDDDGCSCRKDSLKCSSLGELNNQMALDFIRGFTGSASNLATDCVSPRVSTNSLASLQLDIWDGGEGGSTSVSGGNDRGLADIRKTSAADDPPIYHRAVGGHSSGPFNASSPRIQQYLSPRQLMIIGLTPGPCSDGVISGAVSRSTSCLSVSHTISRQPLVASSLAVTSELDGSSIGKSGSYLCNNSRPELGNRNLQVGSMESNSFIVTTPTEDSVDRVSPHNADVDAFDTSGAEFQAEADRFLAAVEQAATIISPDGGIELSAGQTAPPASQTKQMTESANARLNKRSGRLSRNLARTKCLQWLNSLDEGD